MLWTNDKSKQQQNWASMPEKKPMCESCLLRRYSDKYPGSILARIWRWHTGWCPGWKAYQKSLQQKPDMHKF